MTRVEAATEVLSAVPGPEVFPACWRVTVAGLTCPFRKQRALWRKGSCTSQEGETEPSDRGVLAEQGRVEVPG